MADDASTDLRLVEAWAVSQISPRTRIVYRYEGRRLLPWLSDPLALTTVADLQD